MNFVEALTLVDKVVDKYKEDCPKWWRRIEDTPMENDLPVRLALAIAEATSQAVSNEHTVQSLKTEQVVELFAKHTGTFVLGDAALAGLLAFVEEASRLSGASSDKLVFTRSGFRGCHSRRWVTFNVRTEDADEAERRLRGNTSQQEK